MLKIHWNVQVLSQFLVKSCQCIHISFIFCNLLLWKVTDCAFVYWHIVIVISTKPHQCKTQRSMLTVYLKSTPCKQLPYYIRMWHLNLDTTCIFSCHRIGCAVCNTQVDKNPWKDYIGVEHFNYQGKPHLPFELVYIKIDVCTETWYRTILVTCYRVYKVIASEYILLTHWSRAWAFQSSQWSFQTMAHSLWATCIST
jgi:hypothetical protein